MTPVTNAMIWKRMFLCVVDELLLHKRPKNNSLNLSVTDSIDQSPKLPISISEENRWLENIENRPELLRYSKIHSTLTEQTYTSNTCIPKYQT
jgi:hypothetical protein